LPDQKTGIPNLKLDPGKALNKDKKSGKAKSRVNFDNQLLNKVPVR
jgi:hypothetical protein